MWAFGKSTFFAPYIDVNRRGSFIVNLTKTIVYDMPFVLPEEISEQKNIALYLDEKCGTIDTMIEEKEAVIETAWGSADYALDAGVVLMNWALEAYQTEYPDEYAAFIEEYRNRPPELSITLTKENIDSFFESEAN